MVKEFRRKARENAVKLIEGSIDNFKIKNADMICNLVLRTKGVLDVKDVLKYCSLVILNYKFVQGKPEFLKQVQANCVKAVECLEKGDVKGHMKYCDKALKIYRDRGEQASARKALAKPVSPPSGQFTI